MTEHLEDAPGIHTIPWRGTVSDSWNIESFLFFFLKRLMYVMKRGGRAHECSTGGKPLSNKGSL